MTSLTKLMATSALVIGMTTGMAGAATFKVEAWSSQGDGNTAGEDYAVGYGAHKPADANWATDPYTGVGNTPRVAQSPYNSNSLTGTQSYFSVDPTNTPVTLAFNTLQSVFNILWGSVDTYNWITFYNGDEEVGKFGGEAIGTYLNLDTTTPGGTHYEISALVKFYDFTDGGFDSVKFESKNNRYAMEFALAPVPLPAGGLLLLGALGGLTVLRRRAVA